MLQQINSKQTAFGIGAVVVIIGVIIFFVISSQQPAPTVVIPVPHSQATLSVAPGGGAQVTGPAYIAGHPVPSSVQPGGAPVGAQ